MSEMIEGPNAERGREEAEEVEATFQIMLLKNSLTDFCYVSIHHFGPLLVINQVDFIHNLIIFQ